MPAPKHQHQPQPQNSPNQQLALGDEVVPRDKRVVPVRLTDGSVVVQPLPPIDKIILPSTATKSALIKWLHALGYEVKEIYAFLGVKYQMVRNIVTNQPKRAAREDLPKLEVQWRPEPDVVELALDDELERSIMAGRKERIKAARDARNQSGSDIDDFEEEDD